MISKINNMEINYNIINNEENLEDAKIKYYEKKGCVYDKK